VVCVRARSGGDCCERLCHGAWTTQGVLWGTVCGLCYYAEQSALLDHVRVIVCLIQCWMLDVEA
jgi:hypothetical protein